MNPLKLPTNEANTVPNNKSENAIVVLLLHRSVKIYQRENPQHISRGTVRTRGKKRTIIIKEDNNNKEEEQVKDKEAQNKASFSTQLQEACRLCSETPFVYTKQHHSHLHHNTEDYTEQCKRIVHKNSRNFT